MGCDLFVSPTGFYKKSFNPRTHVGCDREWLFDFAIPEVFQSTHPRGVRQISVNTINQRGRFNPRTHVGCDTTIAIIRAIIAGFNPRTHVGCDMRVDSDRNMMWVSIHAPTWGATPPSFNNLTFETVSIHAPTWGATPQTVRAY